MPTELTELLVGALRPERVVLGLEVQARARA